MHVKPEIDMSNDMSIRVKHKVMLVDSGHLDYGNVRYNTCINRSLLFDTSFDDKSTTENEIAFVNVGRNTLVTGSWSVL